MHARVTTLHGAPADVDAGIENFRTNVVPFAREQGKGAILLVNRQSGEALAITLRDTTLRDGRLYASERIEGDAQVAH